VSAPTDITPSIGALAHVNEAKRLEALSLVRAGRVYDLSHELHERVPVFPGRSFHQTLVTTAHHANGGGVGDNEVNWITEVYSSTSQLGTHLDSLAPLSPRACARRPAAAPQPAHVGRGLRAAAAPATSRLRRCFERLRRAERQAMAGLEQAWRALPTAPAAVADESRRL